MFIIHITYMHIFQHMLDLYYSFFLRKFETKTQLLKPQHKVPTRSESPRLFAEYQFFFLFKAKQLILNHSSDQFSIP